MSFTDIGNIWEQRLVLEIMGDARIGQMLIISNILMSSTHALGDAVCVWQDNDSRRATLKVQTRIA